MNTELASSLLPGQLVTVLGGVLVALITVAGGWWTYRSGKNQAEHIRLQGEEQERRIREASNSVDQRKLDQDSFRIFREEYESQRRIDGARLTATENRLTATEDRLRASEEAHRSSEARAQRFFSYLQETWVYVDRLKTVMREHDVPVEDAPESIRRYPWREREDPPAPKPGS